MGTVLAITATIVAIFMMIGAVGLASQTAFGKGDNAGAYGFGVCDLSKLN